MKNDGDNQELRVRGAEPSLMTYNSYNPLASRCTISNQSQLSTTAVTKSYPNVLDGSWYQLRQTLSNDDRRRRSLLWYS